MHPLADKECGFYTYQGICKDVKTGTKQETRLGGTRAALFVYGKHNTILNYYISSLCWWKALEDLLKISFTSYSFNYLEYINELGLFLCEFM